MIPTHIKKQQGLLLASFLAFALVSTSCSQRKGGVQAVSSQGKETGSGEQTANEGSSSSTSGSNGENNGTANGNAVPMSSSTAANNSALLCRDQMGTMIPTQYLDATRNAPGARIVDCYNEQRQLVYKGNAANCYDELTAKFGADIMYPTQTMFPRLYEQARAQGPGAQQMLLNMLRSASCMTLKAQNG